MKRMAFMLLALLVAPAAVQAQVEVGVDAGLTIDKASGSDALTTISVPASSVRIGFTAGDMVSVETLFSFIRASSGGESASNLALIPGVNVSLGEGGFYIRGEAGLMRVSFSDDSGTQFTVGGAAGLKKAVNDGPVSFRMEAGFGRWLENADDGFGAFTRIRLLLGISAALN
jgi:hypothetical protein